MATVAPAPAAEKTQTPVAVSKGYNVAHTWEQRTPLSDTQYAAVSALAQYAAERPIPRHLQDSEDVPSQAPVQQTEVDKEIKLHNSHQFYKWHAELESVMSSETEQKYRHYSDVMGSHVQICDRILGQVDASLAQFEDLLTQHKAVDVKTRTLHDSCERLVVEKERLVEFADALRSKLDFFDELERIASAFHSGSLSIGSDHFLPLLKRLDECIAYVNSNPHYADAASYSIKFRQLHSRALGSVRTHVLNVLKNASAKVQASIAENSTGGGEGEKAHIAEGAETSVLYVRFRAAAPELRVLMEEMESRANRREYQQLLSDCHVLYCEQRLSLLAPLVQDRLMEYANSQELIDLTRSGCAYLMQVCQLEQQLFEHFFQAAGQAGSPLALLLDPLCTVLYDILRPVLLHLTALDTLCDLVDIIKVEVLQEQLGRGASDHASGLKPTAMRLLADVQERLIFRAQIFLRDEVQHFQPADDALDYPGKLERAAAAADQTADGGEGGKEAGEQEGGQGTIADGTWAVNDGEYSSWYPPLERTLACLSKLYRCLEGPVFAGLAQEGVSLCAETVSVGRRLVARKSTLLDGELFLIKHLLILREQIAPFDTEFSVTHKDLDFTHMREHMRRIITGDTQIFTRQALVSLVTQAGPRVLESQVDSKKDLEKQLKATCEEFIMSCTKLTVEPMLSFITKVTAVKVAATASQAEAAAGQAAAEPSKALREQAFAAPDKLAGVVSKVNEAMAGELPAAWEKLKLYLTKPSTRAILFKPIKSNIAEAHAQIARLLETEYTPEDRASIALLGAAELAAKLDALQ